RALEGDAVGRIDLHRVAVAEGELERGRALRGGAVADADDLELLGEALGHPDDHVVDQRAGEAVQGPRLPLVAGPLAHERVGVLADGDGGRLPALEGALGALHRDQAVDDGDVDAGWDLDGSASYA